MSVTVARIPAQSVISRWTRRATTSFIVIAMIGGVLVLAPLAEAASSYTWSEVGSSPPNRYGAALAYDSVRDKTVMFGGYEPSSSGDVADTWEWDGIRWTRRHPSTSPPPRSYAAMAYDSVRQRTVLFGGWSDTSTLGDTWEWDGTDWTQRTPAESPSTRGGAMMAYDASRESIVLFGGNTNVGELDDTWGWDGTTWNDANPSTSPPPRGDGAMAYDAEREEIVLFGGLGSAYLADTWLWDGSTWTPASPTESPTPRTTPAMAYDATREKVVLFGGQNSVGVRLGDTWQWDGSAWTVATPTQSPGPRAAISMAFDTDRGKVVLFGGYDQGGLALGDTWEWDGSSWADATVHSPPARTNGAMAYDAKRGETVLFGGSMNGDLSDTWKWDGARWEQASPATSPPGRYGHAVAYDADREKVVLFGGSSGGVLADTWEWDGTTWAQPTPADSPSALLGAAMAYDATRDTTVLFGGANSSGSTNEMWQWDGTNWTELSPGTLPAARHFPAMAYDEARDKIVLFGGYSTTLGDDLADTWEWDGTTWTPMTPEDSPGPRSFTTMAYDAARQKVVLFGGWRGNDTIGETWEWDGTDWTERTPTVSPLPRGDAMMAYDSSRERVVLFGGYSGHAGVDELGDTWELVVPKSPTVSAVSPLSGPVGTSVMITGTNLMDVGTVSFDGVEATFTSDSDTQITATVPTGATSGPVTLSNSEDSAESEDDFLVTSNLEVSSVNAGSSPMAGSGFDVVVRSTDADGEFADVNADTGVQLALKSGSGTLGGTLTGTIPAGGDQVTISGVTYSKAESGVELTASTTSGNSLAAGDSSAFSVLPGLAAKYLLTGNDTSPVGGDQVTVSAQLADAHGNAVSTAGVPVSWTKDRADGSLSPASSQTNSNGVATVTLTTAPASGLVYKVTATDGSNNSGQSGAITTGASLLKNWAFETDTNPKDGRPDNWGNNASFTRSNTVKFSGNFSGRHRSGGNVGYTIQQTVTGLTAGKTYDFTGRVYVRPTNDDFTLTLQVQWRNNANNPVGPVVMVKQYTKANATGTWDEGASQDLLAPAGATRARIAMVVKKLNATIYVDQFSFREQPA